jgi:Fe-S cluster assembly scaffold protein SufB
VSDLHKKINNTTHSEKAFKAINKPAAMGSDIDLTKFENPPNNLPYQKDVASIPTEDKNRMAGTGVVLDKSEDRSGTFLMKDSTPIHFSSEQEGVEIMSTSEALAKYDWLKDYWWKAVAVDTDKYTASVELNQADGYFIRVLPGHKIAFPVQACLYLAKKQAIQNVHNIIIAEEGSELHIITGCTTAPREDPGLHLGVSEFYIKKNAKLTFTMIHQWNPEVEVRPRTGVIIEENGLYMSNYVLMKPVGSLQMNPTARCVGKNAVARFNSIIVAPVGSNIDTGSRIILEAPGSKAEVISRAITVGGNITARGYIEGKALDVKGHLECRGLIMEKGGTMYAIPELKGDLAGIDLSHEAAVGKIAEEEVEYMMARGLTRDEATATIVRGFLRVDIEGLPPALNAEMKKAIESSEQDLM